MIMRKLFKYETPILLNIFLNDLLLFIKGIKLENFADDNTIYAARNSIEDSLKY